MQRTHQLRKKAGMALEMTMYSPDMATGSVHMEQGSRSKQWKLSSGLQISGWRNGRGGVVGGSGGGRGRGRTHAYTRVPVMAR